MVQQRCAAPPRLRQGFGVPPSMTVLCAPCIQSTSVMIRMRTDADLDRDRAEQEGAVRRAVQQPLQRKCDIMRAAVNCFAFVTSGIAGLLHAVPRFRAVGARVRAVLWSPRHLIDPHVIRVAAGGEGEERVLAERVQPVADAFFVEQANELQFPLTVDRRVRFGTDDERQVDARRRSVCSCDLIGGRRGVGAQRRCARTRRRGCAEHECEHNRCERQRDDTVQCIAVHC